MNEKFPVQESTPISGQSTSYFEAVSPAENTEETVQYSTPESNEADDNQPETSRGRNHNAPRGEQSRNAHNRKRAANHEAGRDNNNEDNQEKTEENRSGSKPLKESLELAYERGNQSMAQQEKQRRQREYEYMEATDGGAVAEGDFTAKEPEQHNTPESSPEQNNQNAPHVASPEGQDQQVPQQSDVQPDINVEDLLQSFDGGKNKTDKTQTAPDRETINKQDEPENAPDQENREASASIKPSIDIDRVVRQYQQDEGMSLEDARAAAVDLAARIEGGSSNGMTAELSEFPNYAANPANTTSSNEGNINWYSTPISSAEVVNPKSEHTLEEADSVPEEGPNTQEFTEETNPTPEEMPGEQDSSEEETNKSKRLQKLGAFAVAGVLALGFTVGFDSAEPRSNGKDEKSKNTNNPEVANDDSDISEALLAVGAGDLAENISSSLPGKEEVEELSGVTINETEDGSGYEVKAMGGTSGEDVLEEVDNLAEKIAKEKLQWNIEDMSIAEPLLEAVGYDVEKLAGSIDDARTFVIDTEAVRKAVLKVAKENPSGVWDNTVNDIAG